MQAVGKYNGISKELQAKIEPLKRGEVATFQMLNGMKNPDPDPGEQVKRPMLFPKHSIPMIDRITDLDGKTVDIVVTEGWLKDEPAKISLFIPGLGEASIFNGRFSFTGGKQKDELMYEYCMISNYNEEPLTGNRDNSKQPLFKLLSAKAESNKTITRVDVLLEALQFAKDMKIDDSRLFASSLNWNEYTDDNELVAKIRDFAREKPDEFIKIYKDPNKAFKAEVKKALALGVITFDMQNGAVKMSDEVITTIAQKDRADLLGALGEWFNVAKNGKEVLNSIKKQVKQRSEPALV